MLYLIVYLLDVYGSFVNTLNILTIIGIAATILAIFTSFLHLDYKDYEGTSAYSNQYRGYYELSIKLSKILGKIFFTLGIVTLLLPSKQGLAMLGGVYVGSQVYDSLDKSAITQKAIKVLNQELDGYLDQMLKEKEPKK